MSFTMPPTTSSSEPRPSSKTQLFRSMPPPSRSSTPSTTMLNLERRSKRKSLVRPLPSLPKRRRRADTFSPPSRADKPQELLTTMSLSNSPLVDSSPASLQDQASPVEPMAISLKEESSISTSRKWRRRRSEQLDWARYAFLCRSDSDSLI